MKMGGVLVMLTGLGISFLATGIPSIFCINQATLLVRDVCPVADVTDLRFVHPRNFYPPGEITYFQ